MYYFLKQKSFFYAYISVAYLLSIILFSNQNIFLISIILSISYVLYILILDYYITLSNNKSIIPLNVLDDKIRKKLNLQYKNINIKNSNKNYSYKSIFGSDMIYVNLNYKNPIRNIIIAHEYCHLVNNHSYKNICYKLFAVNIYVIITYFAVQFNLYLFIISLFVIPIIFTYILNMINHTQEYTCDLYAKNCVGLTETIISIQTLSDSNENKLRLKLPYLYKHPTQYQRIKKLIKKSN